MGSWVSKLCDFCCSWGPAKEATAALGFGVMSALSFLLPQGFGVMRLRNSGEGRERLKKIQRAESFHSNIPSWLCFSCLPQKGMVLGRLELELVPLSPGAMVVTPPERGGTGQRGALCLEVSMIPMWVSPGRYPCESKKGASVLGYRFMSFRVLLVCILVASSFFRSGLKHLCCSTWLFVSLCLLLATPLGWGSPNST